MVRTDPRSTERDRHLTRIVTVTQSVPLRCRWCGGDFAPTPGPGRPRAFCRRSHRQRAYEARKLAEAHRLGADDILITRSTFEAIRDVFYRIEAALQDIDSDLAAGVAPSEYRTALWHLYQAAADVRSASIEPKAIG